MQIMGKGAPGTADGQQQAQQQQQQQRADCRLYVGSLHYDLKEVRHTHTHTHTRVNGEGWVEWLTDAGW
jgi:transposase